jgi:hypothetical protein
VHLVTLERTVFFSKKLPPYTIARFNLMSQNSAGRDYLYH